MKGPSESISQPLPYDEEAEQAVLSSIMQDWPGLAEEIMERVTSAWFYHPTHQQAWTLLCELAHAGGSCNAKELIRIARIKGHESTISPAFASELQGAAITAGFWRHHADRLEAALQRRTLRNVSVTISEAAYDLANDPASEVDKASGMLADLQIGKAQEPATAGEVAWGALELIKANQESPRGIKTGLGSIDEKFPQWLPGNMHIIAARPGQGKTAMATCLLEQWAVKQGIPCLFISLEMSREQLGARFMAQMSGVPLGFILGADKRPVREHETHDLQSAAVRMGEAPFWIEDKAGMTYRQVVGCMRRHVARNKVKVVFVDYIQLVRGVGNEDNFTRLENTSLALTEAAKSLGVVLVALAQFNREASKRGARASRPKASDLRGGGCLEQDAALVAGLYKPSNETEWADLKTEEQKAWGDEDRYRSFVEFHVMKSRYSQADVKASLKWIGEQTRFDSWE
jgi:replicative DNA helicase